MATRAANSAACVAELDADLPQPNAGRMAGAPRRVHGRLGAGAQPRRGPRPRAGRGQRLPPGGHVERRVRPSACRRPRCSSGARPRSPRGRPPNSASTPRSCILELGHGLGRDRRPPRGGSARMTDDGTARLSWNRELFIDGEWTSEGADRRDRRDRPRHRGAHRQRPRGVDEDRGGRDRGGPPGVRRGAVAVDEARRARRRSWCAWRRSSSPAPRELRELIVAETGSAGFITDFVQAAGSIGMFRSNAAIAEHTFPWVEAEPPDRRPHRGREQRHRAGADRGGLRHHPVQLPVHAQHGEGRAGARGRVHRRPQAPPVDAARRA